MPSPALLIRPFVSADQPAVRALILDGLGDRFDYVDPTLNPDLDDITASYLVPGHGFLVAEVGAELAGTAALRVEAGAGQIVRVSVARQFRRLGIGRALVAALLAVASRRGLRRVWMETNDDWRDAIGLYRGCGFRPFDHRDGCIFMELLLPATKTPEVRIEGCKIEHEPGSNSRDAARADRAKP